MVKVNYSETLTYTEWEQIHNALKEEKRAEKRYFTKQKIMGGVLVICAVLSPLLIGDFVSPFFTLPLGVGVMVTKNKVI